MAYRESYGGFGGGFSVTPWVKRLLIANVAVFLLMAVLDLMGMERTVMQLLWFQPVSLLQPPFPIWTALTYAFVHSGIGHIFFNLLTLFFFGPALEERWGSRDFIVFYLVAAVGGALFSLAQPLSPIVGASAAINGLMLAYAMTWPDNVIHVWGIFPIKVKWLVAILAVVSLLYVSRSGGDGVAHLAHLGGFVTAFLYMKSPWGPRGWGTVAPVAKKRKPALAWKAGKAAAPPAAAAAPVPEARRERRGERELLDEVDRILDKISTQGMQSLTEQERERLQELSRQRRTN